MTTNLRDRVERDLAISLEGRWGMSVILTGPDGTVYSVKKDTTLPLKGQVLYDIVRTDPDTAEEIIINNPVVTLRRSSLVRIPQPGERWLIEVPNSPVAGSPTVIYGLSPMRPPEGGRSVGFIRLYCVEIEQS